jgi:phosphatidylglycerol lysyltransferase
VIPSYRKGEATVDLMRHRINTPNGIMDYLFVKLFLRNKDQGFDRFNLGMVPMTGFQPHEEASPEERAIHVFVQHLNFLFSFKGLLAYKAKFATSWEPRCAVYRTPLDLVRLAFALNRVSEVRGQIHRGIYPRGYSVVSCRNTEPEGWASNLTEAILSL